MSNEDICLTKMIKFRLIIEDSLPIFGYADFKAYQKSQFFTFGMKCTKICKSMALLIGMISVITIILIIDRTGKMFRKANLEQF